MDHAEVLELIDVAAAEPDGLARLAAGDTAESAAVAGHLAGCGPCATELTRTARTATLARQAIRELPDPALRERTLAYVRDVGRDRSRSVVASASVLGSAEPAPPGLLGLVPGPAALPRSAASEGSAVVIPLAPRRTWRAWWATASVAAVLVAAVAGFALGGAVRPAAPVDHDGGAIAVAQTTMHIARQPDVVSVALAGTGGAPGWGALLYSASTGELAMTVAGMSPAPDGATYACWVEQGGEKRRIGVLYMDGTDGTWAGKVSGLADLAPGTSFGVSLVPAGASTGTPVLLGKT